MSDTTTVLIVGGGITGLSTALFLVRHGVHPILVERHPSTALQPQAQAFTPRTMEIYRAFGLADEIRGRTSLLADFPEMIGDCPHSTCSPGPSPCWSAQTARTGSRPPDHSMSN
jgi:hypothetical protein